MIEARKLLADWFYQHIQKVDRELGGFLLERMNRQAGVETGRVMVSSAGLREPL